MPLRFFTTFYLLKLAGIRSATPWIFNRYTCPYLTPPSSMTIGIRFINDQSLASGVSRVYIWPNVDLGKYRCDWSACEEKYPGSVIPMMGLHPAMSKRRLKASWKWWPIRVGKTTLLPAWERKNWMDFVLGIRPSIEQQKTALSDSDRLAKK